MSQAATGNLCLPYLHKELRMQSCFKSCARLQVQIEYLHLLQVLCNNARLQDISVQEEGVGVVVLQHDLLLLLCMAVTILNHVRYDLLVGRTTIVRALEKESFRPARMWQSGSF